MMPVAYTWLFYQFLGSNELAAINARTALFD